MKKLLTILAMVGLIMGGSSPAGAGELWGIGNPDGYTATGPSPVIFKFDTSTGLLQGPTLGFETENWMWISGIADGGKYLYASHNTYPYVNSPEFYDFKIAKINRFTGEVISDTSIAGFLGQTFSQVNALDFHNDKLYGVENATSGSAIRGYAMEILLGDNGDVVGATKGAFVGPYPDGGLDFHDGLWYATSWGYSGPPKLEGSMVYTSPDIMYTNFIQQPAGSGVGERPGVKGIGMIDGWEFDGNGNLFAVASFDPVAYVWSDMHVYAITSVLTGARSATPLYDLSSQLPAGITSLNGLSEIVVPVATSKDACKKGGWQLLAREDDTPFKNQGDCIQYVNTGK